MATYPLWRLVMPPPPRAGDNLGLVEGSFQSNSNGSLSAGLLLSGSTYTTPSMMTMSGRCGTARTAVTTKKNTKMGAAKLLMVRPPDAREKG
jgi:hypothetical protein